MSFDEEKFYNDFKLHNEAFNFDQDIKSAQNFAVQYAQIGLKHMFLINGGALIAMPAIIAAFDIQKDQILWVAGLLFCIGLIFSVLPYLFAYFSLMSAVQGLHFEKHEHYYRLLNNSIDDANDQLKLEYKANIERCVRSAEKKRFWAGFWETLAVLFSFLSLCFFILGTYQMTIVVWS